MKKIFSTGLILLVAVFVQAQKTKTITITGNVTGDTKGLNAVYYFTKSTPMDSVMIKDGKFKIKIPFNQSFTQAIYTRYELGPKRNMGYRPFPVLIDGTGDINISMNIDSGFWKCTMTGSKTAVLHNSFLKKQNETYGKINDEVKKIYGKSYAKENDPIAAQLSKSRDSLTKMLMGGMIADFVSQHKDSYIGVYVLANSGRGAFDVDQLEVLLKSLSPAMQKTEEGEKLTAYIYGVRNTSIGVTIKDFELNDQNGKAVSFAQFKGKYVWIDFWASWCGPCKQAFPHMKELYASYKDKGFEIVGVSTDATIDPWLKALPKLENPWPQLWDNKNIASQFAVTAFPTGFLIDPNGKILAKEIGFDDKGKGPIETKLEEIFGAAKISTDKPVSDKVTQTPKVLNSIPATPLKQ